MNATIANTLQICHWLGNISQINTQPNFWVLYLFYLKEKDIRRSLRYFLTGANFYNFYNNFMKIPKYMIPHTIYKKTSFRENIFITLCFTTKKYIFKLQKILCLLIEIRINIWITQRILMKYPTSSNFNIIMLINFFETFYVIFLLITKKKNLNSLFRFRTLNIEIKN